MRQELIRRTVVLFLISTMSIATVGISAIIIRRNEFANERSTFSRMKFAWSRSSCRTVILGRDGAATGSYRPFILHYEDALAA